MAAYWRSPYREISVHRKNPNHSTLKFEQSLHLSRARSSVNFGRQDLFDPGLRSSTANGGSHPTNNTSNNDNINPLYRPEGLHRSQTNATIKSILKPPKTQRANSLPVEEPASYNVRGENDKENEIIEPLKKDKKRVRFGGSQRRILNFESENSMHGHPNCESNALKRLTHSRLIEETAMKKLNRLIAGVASDNPSVLPSVKGRGLLSQNLPKDGHSKSPKSCYHSNDLKCIRCIKKDVENDVFDGVFGNDNINRKTTKNLHITGDKANKVKLKDLLAEANKVNNHTIIAENQSETLDGVQCRSPVSNSSSYSTNKRKFRLLPGRYPFTSGAMQIKKLLVPEQNNIQNGGDLSSETVIQSNTVDLHLERAFSQVSSNYYLRAMSDRSPSPRMNNGQNRNRSPSPRMNKGHNRNIGQNQSSKNEPMKMPAIPVSFSTNDQPQTNTNHALDNDKDCGENGPQHNVSQLLVNGAGIDTPTVISELVEESPKDKTSEILEWLNDVQRNQTLANTSKNARPIAVESQ